MSVLQNGPTKRPLDASGLPVKKRVKKVAAKGVANPEKKVKRSVKRAVKEKKVFTRHADAAESLDVNGFAVMPLYGNGVTARLRNALDLTVQGFPEFVPHANDRSPLGGFGVYNNPGSFHCQPVRVMRLAAYGQMFPVLDLMKPTSDYKTEMLIDRLMIRPAGCSPSSETWHRDEAKTALDDDIIFGGWINLDEYDQLFSCIPCSHVGVTGNNGFNVIKDKAEIASLNNQRVRVVVPPGHILIFNEKIIHEVFATKKKYDSYRLFTAFRLTRSNAPLHANLDKMLDDQAAVTIKSGQKPAMWAKLHWTNWVDKLEEYSENFREQCLECAEVKSGTHIGRVVTRVHRHMTSLKDYGLPLYPEYLLDERRYYKPH